MTLTLPTSQLQPNPFQPRGKAKVEEVSELALSIKSYGIIEPIVVAKTPAGYQIIAGERRWRAAQQVGLTEVPVHVKKTTPKGMMEMALIENVQRVDLDPIERAQAFRQLIRNFNYTNVQLAKKIGKSDSYVSNSLRLLELPDAITDSLVAGVITEGHARALNGIENESDAIAAFKTIVKEHASVRRAEELARRYREAAAKTDSQEDLKKTKYQIADSVLARWQEKFNQFFHAQSQLRLTRSQRQTKVTITLKGSPQETQQDLERIIQLAEKK